jgi:uncharacterized protein
MYQHVVKQYVQVLKNIEQWLDKAEQFAAEKDFDVDVLIHSRLAPDMKDFAYQIQSACDYVKGAAGWLSGEKPPSHADTERTLLELRERIRKTVAYAEGIDENRFAVADEQKIQLGWMPGKILGAQDYLLQMSIPSVFFHVCTAYAILRHNGVNLGKMDFLGEVSFVDGAPTVL